LPKDTTSELAGLSFFRNIIFPTEFDFFKVYEFLLNWGAGAGEREKERIFHYFC